MAASIAVPPYDMSGNGAPTTGINPITIEILINTYNEKLTLKPSAR